MLSTDGSYLRNENEKVRSIITRRRRCPRVNEGEGRARVRVRVSQVRTA